MLKRAWTVAAVVALTAGLLSPGVASAAQGSLISGVAWADANRDGLRTPDESVKPGVTVELLSSPSGPVVRTTTTGTNGGYSFANMADGSYYVRVVAPGAHRFPDSAAGQNVFARAEIPTTGNPERGITGPVAIAGATQVTARDAGLQPIATLKIDRLQIPSSCEGYATTGAAPWDPAPGPGMDTGPDNCLVRVGDTVLQNYSVSLTGLPAAVTVPNVVIEMTINPVADPEDPSDVADARLRLSGPGTNGLPAGCLAAENGANPASSAVTRPDGSIVVVCNLGPMSSNVGSVQLAYRFADNTPIPGFADVTARAYTGQDDAAESGSVRGPVVEVTGTAEWEAKKSLQNGPIRATRTINGVPTLGFDHYYWIDIDNLRGAGGSELEWPITLTDRMTQFPNAILHYCAGRQRPGDDRFETDWTVTCPKNEAAGADGWPITVSKPANSPYESAHILVGAFVPATDAYRAVDAGWQPGDAPPAGTVAWENRIEHTDGWHMIGGQPNNPPGGSAPGFEPGWDGTTATGDNVVSRQFPTTTPRWDLQKGNTALAPQFQQRDLDNDPATPATPGFVVQYAFNISESGGSLITSNIDDLAFKDVMTQYPDAVLLSCSPSTGNFNTGTPTCETGPQPADGWDMSFTPNSNGNTTKSNTWTALFFVPTPSIPDPCRANVNDTFSVRNEARDTDGWTAGGWLVNDTGREPGWDGNTATGNNVATRTFTVRSTVSDCGTLQGDKQYEGITGGLTAWNQFSLGDVVNSHVWTSATTARISVTDPMLCDVFDVSVWRISGDPLTPVTGADPNPHLQDYTGNPGFDRNDYVIEYAVGTNAVDTQTGGGNGLDNSANVTEVRACRDEDGPWTTDPAATFGADWRDEVNMVRVRPVIAGHVETGPFTLGLYLPLQSRWQYNGGPNAGEDIPQGVLLNNSGGFYETGQNGAIVWTDVSRQLAANLPLVGYKRYTNGAGNAWVDNGTIASGQRVQSWTELSADAPTQDNGNYPARGVQAPGAQDTRGFPVDSPTVCDTFDVSVLAIDGPASAASSIGLDNPGGYVIEYAAGSNAVDTQAGPQAGGLYPVDRSSLVADNTNCRRHSGPWQTDPTAFGVDWRDRVNMVRVRPADPAHTEHAGFVLSLKVPLRVRSVYNGGPNSGEPMLTGIRLSNVGGWSQGPRGDGWNLMQKELRYQGMRLAVAKTVGQATYLPGQDAIWNLSIGINDAAVGAVMENVRVIDTVPAGLIYNPVCTQSRLPAGVTVSYNAATREVIFSLGDITATAANYWVRTGATALQLCATLETVAQPGDTYVNTVRAESPSSQNTPTATATTRATGSGQLGLVKTVDKPFVASGETYTWSLDWANTSTVISYQPTDLIDVLPWNGDGQAGVGSARDQYASDYEGVVQLTGALAAPTFVRGGAGSVAGTWYYATSAPATLSHDPRDPANADPAAPGGLWRTAAEITDFDDVTAVRFVAAEWLGTGTRVRALIPMVSTSTDLDNVYVNRAMIYSPTFPTQPLLSSEPYVLMPGFTLGDLVWIDRNGNGRFDAGEQGAAGVTVQVRDADGEVVASAITDAQGRWSVAKIPAGRYTVHIPAAMFRAGGPLADHVVRTVGSSDANDPNETADNNNTATPDPESTGLSSTPVTLSYRYDGGRLIGADGPTGEDVAGLAPPLIPDAFSTFSVDLALLPEPAIDIEKSTNGQDADEPTGPYIPLGGEVRWTYVVTNTGAVDLTDIEVTDDKVDPESIECSGTGTNFVPGPLAPGGAFSCTATGAATAGQYENTGTVTALDPTATEVTDDDLSHYFGWVPEVDIEKATNGADADEGTGPTVAVGSPVRWTYVVTNTGNVPLTNVTVTDDMVDAAVIDCGGTGSNVIPGPLAPTASVTCVATGSAVAGQYVNAGSVTGTAPTTTSPEGEPEEPPLEVTDRDLSHYFGAAPTIDIEKATNGEDADEAPGVRVSEGAAITWTYVVTNTGNVALRDIVVTDDKIAASQIDCDGTGQNVITGPLEPGASFTCIAQGLAAAGQYENTGTVTAAGPQLTGEDGEPEPPVEVTDEDLSHYFAAAPAIDIEKWTNGADADAVPGPFVMVGGSVRWTYTVTNVGNVPLMSITVTDDQVDAADIDCDGTGANLIAGPLAPGASFTCVAAGTATSGQYVNTGAVSGVDPDQQQVTDEDPSHYFGAVPGVDIEKSTNGQDADDAPGVHVGAGSVVEWTYVVTNTGNVPLTDISVADDKVPAGDIWCGGVQSHVVPGPLQPGDSLTCNAFGSAIAGPYANLGTVAAEVPGLDVVITDEDPSHYTGFAAGPPTQPAPAAVAGLPVTGGAAIPIASIVGGSVLALVGGLLVVIGRRRRKA